MFSIAHTKSRFTKNLIPVYVETSVFHAYRKKLFMRGVNRKIKAGAGKLSRGITGTDGLPRHSEREHFPARAEIGFGKNSCGEMETFRCRLERRYIHHGGWIVMANSQPAHVFKHVSALSAGNEKRCPPHGNIWCRWQLRALWCSGALVLWCTSRTRSHIPQIEPVYVTAVNLSFKHDFSWLHSIPYCIWKSEKKIQTNPMIRWKKIILNITNLLKDNFLH